MAPPIRVEVTRGSEVESVHEVDAVAVDTDGRHLAAWGDPVRPVLPRSAIKPVQAWPVIRLRPEPVRLALAGASHHGEPFHVEAVTAWLSDLGLGVDQLECGGHAPVDRAAAEALIAAGRRFGAVHNDCSGKHAGFLAVCVAHDIAPAGYIGPDHPLQRDHVTPAIETWCELDLSGRQPGIDGCGIPVWAIPLDRLALGWARLGADTTGAAVFDAMVAHPEMVAGTHGDDTAFIRAGRGRVVTKTGAEGVWCAIDRTSGTALALKARDGATRASRAAVGWVLAELGAWDGTVADTAPHVGGQPSVVHNWAGTAVGEVRVVA